MLVNTPLASCGNVGCINWQYKQGHTSKGLVSGANNGSQNRAAIQVLLYAEVRWTVPTKISRCVY